MRPQALVLVTGILLVNVDHRAALNIFIDNISLSVICSSQHLKFLGSILNEVGRLFQDIKVLSMGPES